MTDSISSLGQKFKELWNKTSQHLVHGFLDPNQVDDPTHCVKINEGNSYIRVVLAEMYLAKESHVFKDYLPAVTSKTQFEFDNESIDIINVADSSKMGEKAVMTKGDIIAKNYQLTPLIPFNSGLIQLDVVLCAIQGENGLGKFLSTLTDFSELLSIPQFSTVLNIAAPLAKGVQALFDIGEFQLHLHDAFSQGQQCGYYVAIGATEKQVNNKDLRVVKNSLRILNPDAPSKDLPFEGFNYMLIRIEVSQGRSDWNDLKFIKDPLKEMDKAIYAGNKNLAKQFLFQIYLIVSYAPEFTDTDRENIKIYIKNHYDDLLKTVADHDTKERKPIDIQKSIEHTATLKNELSMKAPDFSDLFQ